MTDWERIDPYAQATACRRGYVSAARVMGKMKFQAWLDGRLLHQHSFPTWAAARAAVDRALASATMGTTHDTTPDNGGKY